MKNDRQFVTSVFEFLEALLDELPPDALGPKSEQKLSELVEACNASEEDCKTEKRKILIQGGASQNVA